MRNFVTTTSEHPGRSEDWPPLSEQLAGEDHIAKRTIWPKVREWGGAVMAYLKTSKPTEWLTVMAIAVGAYCTYQSGIISVSREANRLENLLIKKETREFEDAKNSLVKEVALLNLQVKEYRRPHDAMGVLKKIYSSPLLIDGEEVSLGGGLKFDFKVGGYELTVESHLYVGGFDRQIELSRKPVAHPVVGDILRAAKDLGQIKSLKISGFCLRKNDIGIINELDMLEYLDMSNAPMFPDVLSELRLPSGLTSLVVENAGIKQVPSINPSLSLKSLSVRGNDIDDAGVRVLCENYPSLRSLDISSTRASGGCVEALGGMGFLSTLYVTQTQWVTEDMVRFASREMPCIVNIEGAKVKAAEGQLKMAEERRRLQGVKSRVYYQPCGVEYDGPAAPPVPWKF